MTDVWAPTPGRPYVTDTYSQAVGITNTLALPDNTSGPTYDGFNDGYNVKMAPFNARGDGVADDTAAIQAAHTAAAAATPKGKVVVPIGTYKITSTVNLLTSMHGLGGQGYTSSHPRAVFVPTITNGTPALRGLDLDGANFTNFSVDTGEPCSTALNCIGLQLGQCNGLIASITKTTSTSLTIVTKYLHTFAVGDSVTFASVTGMTELTGAYTITGVTLTSKSFTVTTVDNSGWGTFTPGTHKGLIFSTDLGVATKVGRGVQRDIYVNGCATGFHLAGWINTQTGLYATNCTLGLDGSYLNSNVLDLSTENCGQAVQLLGCNKLNILKLEDEGGVAGSLAAASTIDYSNTINVGIWSTEGTRTTDTPWLEIANVNLCYDVHIPRGIFGATPGSAKSVTLGNVTRYTLPDPAQITDGFSVTSSSEPDVSYAVTWSSDGTQPVLNTSGSLATLTGFYHWSGSSVTVTVALTTAANTTYGTGNYLFSLPFTAKRIAVGAVKILDNGTAHYIGTCLVLAGGTDLYCFAPAQIANNYPHTWATTDTLYATITYSV